jgi:hypothetical protein
MNALTKVSQFLLFVGSLVILSTGGSLKSVSAQTTTISPVAGAFSLQQINGHKVVATSGGLHAVFADGTTVKYSTSTIGASWSVPITIATNASYPTIAVAGNMIGIAYAKAGLIYYRYKLNNGSWSTPVQVTTVGGTELAMVGYGSNMYLAWASGSSVSYTSFPANSPAGAAWEMASILILCGTTNVFEPAIAVIPTSSSNSVPKVRIAYFYQRFYNSNNNCSSQSIFEYGTFVVEKATPQQVNFTVIYGGPNTANLSTTGRVSMAVAANRSTGEFYLAKSEQTNGVASTNLIYQNAWNNGPWRSVQILPRKSLIDVAAASCSKFRIAVSDFTMGNGSYGPAWYRTGEWTGQTPTWVESAGVQVSSLARDPQVLFWTGHYGLSSNRDVHAMYDEQAGGSYFVRHDAYLSSGRGLNDCRIRNLRDEKRAVASGHERRKASGAGLVDLTAEEILTVIKPCGSSASKSHAAIIYISAFCVSPKKEFESLPKAKGIKGSVPTGT